MTEKKAKFKGLSAKEVEQRKREGLVNVDTTSNTKTMKEIVLSNVFTLFNIINIVLAIAIIAVGSFKNLAFIIIIVVNTLISIFQETRSKKTLDKLQVLAEQKVTVIRDGVEKKIGIEEIVLDDIVLFSNGNQVVVDSVILDGEVEVDESFITGESETIAKEKNDSILSGSFIVSGKAICKVEHVGKDNYTAKIGSDTKYIKPISSEIMQSLNRIIETISFLIVPVGILLFSRQLYLEGNNLTQAVVNTVAALIGMIPEGLVLLTSTVLAVSVIRLSQRKVLVQDLYCIETLARVDTLCIDKTGTITTGEMEVVDTILKTDQEVNDIVGSVVYALDDNNPTAIALKKKFVPVKKLKVDKKISFSSKKKYSGITCGKDTYLIGAPEFVLDSLKGLTKELEEYSNNYRVLAVVKKTGSKKTLLAFILIQDQIRKEAKDTLNYFRENNVDLKIISGDNPNTVLSIAKRAGLKEDALAIDAHTLKTDKDIIAAIEKYDVFGRVSPEQKKDFVIALQNAGHTVAMTGDGVNDVLALKESNCSVAMAAGSDAAKNVSQLVLLDNNFQAMTNVIKEGRRTINNIERSASLFLVKTIYATLLSLIFIFIQRAYPFIPIQLTLTSVVTIGIPSFVLALEPNEELVSGRFMKNILKKAVPPALTIVLNILIIITIANFKNLSVAEISTLSVMMTSYTSFVLLYKICQPFNLMRKALFGLMIAFFVVGAICFQQVFNFSNLTFIMVLIIICCICISHFIYALLEKVVTKVIDEKM
ncbi:MAG: HAD-IC family P-type ATPase [Bacilli bacterium]|nr:HAD-IC family P-type ATPase [Bacilli bacterium]